MRKGDGERQRKRQEAHTHTRRERAAQGRLWLRVKHPGTEYWSVLERLSRYLLAEVQNKGERRRTEGD